MTQTRITFSAMWSDKLGEAIKARTTEPYRIHFGMAGADFEALRDAVNQGIDAHLEAVRFKQNGNTFYIEPETLHTLVRRLIEADSEEANSFGSAICETLGIELI